MPSSQVARVTSRVGVRPRRLCTVAAFRLPELTSSRCRPATWTRPLASSFGAGRLARSSQCRRGPPRRSSRWRPSRPRAGSHPATKRLRRRSSSLRRGLPAPSPVALRARRRCRPRESGRAARFAVEGARHPVTANLTHSNPDLRPGWRRSRVVFAGQCRH